MTSRSSALFNCLLEDLGYPSPDPSPFQTHRAYAASYLVQSVLKKFTDHISDEADDRALEKFNAVNEKCGTWTLECESWEDELVGELKQQIYRFWNPKGVPLVSSFSAVFERGRVGPGASVGALGNDFYTKLFSGPLTCTSFNLYLRYKDYIQRFPTWDAAEVLRAEHYGIADVVEGSRLGFVPKTNDISRVICTEPSLNMFCQLGLGAHLEDRLRSSFGIELDNQPTVNRELARQGSLNSGPNTLVTIDLSSASDSLSLGMLKEFLPRDFYRQLELYRCASTKVRGKTVMLNMVSTMGNGFTFPLQTALFACVVSAAANYRGVKLERATRSLRQSCDPTGESRRVAVAAGNWSVFGDDIVCPSSISRDVLRLLEILGFSVNKQKTFVEGPFRESCGRDYFLGHDVRPVFLKGLTTQQDRFVAINLLNEWSARTGLHLSRSIRYLLSLVGYYPVPYDENNDAGVRVPYFYLGSNARHDKNLSAIYTRWVVRPKALSVSEVGIFVPASLGRRKPIYNPNGLLLVYLRGDLVSGRISVRHDVTSYHAKRRVTPCWDRFVPSDDIVSSYDWRQWKTAVYFNLTG